jgi:SAM-dependent methyltransferase
MVKETLARTKGERMPRIMDLGCGTASYVPQLREYIPDFEYIGVEPIESSFKQAVENLQNFPNAKVHFQLGYDEVGDEAVESFDLVFSLSALEHIKQLDRFIALSAKYTRPGGIVMHRYDLGHALHPHSLKERLHVFLGNTFPNILPERKFVRYVGVPEVERLYIDNSLRPTDVTYHQMPNHKAIEKFFKDSKTTLVDDLFAWEMKYQNEIKTLPVTERERLFPAVAVWGEKR